MSRSTCFSFTLITSAIVAMVTKPPAVLAGVGVVAAVAGGTGGLLAGACALLLALRAPGVEAATGGIRARNFKEYNGTMYFPAEAADRAEKRDLNAGGDHRKPTGLFECCGNFPCCCCSENGRACQDCCAEICTCGRPDDPTACCCC